MLLFSHEKHDCHGGIGHSWFYCIHTELPHLTLGALQKSVHCARWLMWQVGKLQTKTLTQGHELVVFFTILARDRWIRKKVPKQDKQKIADFKWKQWNIKLPLFPLMLKLGHCIIMNIWHSKYASGMRIILGWSSNCIHKKSSEST